MTKKRKTKKASETPITPESEAGPRAPSEGGFEISHKAAYRIAARIGAYDWRLPSGARLGKAALDEVLAAADFYGKLAESNAHNRKVFLKIAARMKKMGAKVCEDAWPEEELAKLMRRTRND